MNLASALIKRVLELQDYDTWTNVRKHYLPNEYHSLFDIVTKHSDTFFKLPSLEDLKLEIRDSNTLDKVYALETIETEAEPFLLLEYLKNEFAQREVLFQIDKWIDSSMAFESAEEVVRHIQNIGIELEDKVDLNTEQESMQKINLFESEEEMANRIPLGLNADFDSQYLFNSTDYILFGGRRGSGKSITCSNIANTIVERGKKVLYFSIEMESRQILQRACSIATEIPFQNIRNKNLDNKQWEKVAAWWSTRYVGGETIYEEYLQHRNFLNFHKAISRLPLGDAYVDVVFDSGLTLSRINSEVRKRVAQGNLGAIIVDYINKTKRTSGVSHSLNHLDWKEQLSVSHSFKEIGQNAGVPIISAFQTDESGEARISKGILDSCDAAFNLTPHKGEEPAITFEAIKMRGDDEKKFTSSIVWPILKIGPHSVPEPVKEGKEKKGSITVKASNAIYDD